MGILSKLFKRKQARPAVKAYAAIGEAEVNARLLGAPDNPVYQALCVVADEEIVRLIEEAVSEKDTNDVYRRLGGIDALNGLKARWEERIQEAREAEAKKEQQTEESNGE